MKNNTIIILYSISLLYLSACREIDDIPSRLCDEQLNFYSLNCDPKTKIVYSDSDEGLKIEWKQNDKIGIFANVSNNVRFENSAYHVADIVNGGNCLFYPDNEYEAIKSIPDKAINIYSYYPYSSKNDNEESILLNLPALQLQNSANDVSHLSEYSFMKAFPQEIVMSNGIKNVNLKFINVFSILELSVGLSDASEIDVPIKELKLISTEGFPLSMNNGTINLVQNIDNDNHVDFKVGDPFNDITLKLKSSYTIKKGETAKFYFTLLPGYYENLSVEIVAIDNSRAICPILSEKSLKSNTIYKGNVTFSNVDLEPLSPFEIEKNSYQINLGESITFDFSGYADEIQFYSGEEGNDYAYSNTDRLADPDIMNLSFVQQSDMNNIPNPMFAPISYSLDFNGIYTEESMNASVWTDISDNFKFPNETKIPISSGECDIIPLFKGQDYLYLRFSYAFEYMSGNFGRTIVRIRDLNVISFLEGFEPVVNIDQITADWQKVLPENNPAAVDCYINSKEVYFSCPKWQPAYPGEAWVIFRVDKNKFNKGKDLPIVVKGENDQIPENFIFTYTTKGRYKAVFVVKRKTIQGDLEEIKEVIVNVD